MSEPFLGQVISFAFNFAPRNFTMCDGQLLAISQNQALFSLLGTTYGGDGETTFALPDLRGRAPMHTGSGPGLTPRQIGQRSGQEDVTLMPTQMPSHNHPLNAVAETANTPMPLGHALAAESHYREPPQDTSLSTNSVGVTGSAAGHNNLQPYLVINWCIALSGLFPSPNFRGNTGGGKKSEK